MRCEPFFLLRGVFGHRPSVSKLLKHDTTQLIRDSVQPALRVPATRDVLGFLQNLKSRAARTRYVWTCEGAHNYFDESHLTAQTTEVALARPRLEELVDLADTRGGALYWVGVTDLPVITSWRLYAGRSWSSKLGLAWLHEDEASVEQGMPLVRRYVVAYAESHDNKRPKPARVTVGGLQGFNVAAWDALAERTRRAMTADDTVSRITKRLHLA